MKILIFRIVGINSPPCFGMDENKGGINQRGGINSRISVDSNATSSDYRRTVHSHQPGTGSVQESYGHNQPSALKYLSYDPIAFVF